jgi:hypothetical protein
MSRYHEAEGDFSMLRRGEQIAPLLREETKVARLRRKEIKHGNQKSWHAEFRQGAN